MHASTNRKGRLLPYSFELRAAYAGRGMSSHAACGVNGCRAAARYQFAAASAPIDVRCPRHALVYCPVLGRAVRVAVVVGTVLFAINQSDVVLAGQVTAAVVVKIGLTYLVPFSFRSRRIRRSQRIGCGLCNPCACATQCCPGPFRAPLRSR
jgi:hypothetical protein